MKKNLALNLMALTGLSIFITQAMEKDTITKIATVAQTYNGKIITPENISQFSHMPDEIGNVVNKWAEKNKGLLQILVPESVACNNQAASMQIGQSILALQKAGIQVPLKQIKLNDGRVMTMAPASYIFPLPETIGNKKYYIQISGPMHKIYNLESYNGIGWGQGLKNDSKVVDTFQTVSRVWGYLQIKQAIKKNSITKFDVPATYLAHIPGRSNFTEGAFDKNSFVVQEDRGDDLVYLKDNKDLISKLSDETIEQTYKVMKQGVLWDIKGNGLINKNTFNLGQADLEQPNNQNPEIFGYNYYQDGKKLLAWNANAKESAAFKISNDTKCAITGFANILQEALKEGKAVTDQCKIYQKIVNEDAEIKKEFSDGHLKECLESIKFSELN